MALLHSSLIQKGSFSPVFAPSTAKQTRCCASGSDLTSPTSAPSSTTSSSSSRRQLLAGTAAVLVGTTPVLKAAAAAGDPAGNVSTLPAVPGVALSPQLQVSKVIKGCWQLSGGHKGDRQTDRTAAAQAVEVCNSCWKACALHRYLACGLGHTLQLVSCRQQCNAEAAHMTVRTWQPPSDAGMLVHTGIVS
jgi:hypothetical protein